MAEIKLMCPIKLLCNGKWYTLNNLQAEEAGDGNLEVTGTAYKDLYSKQVGFRGGKRPKE